MSAVTAVAPWQRAQLARARLRPLCALGDRAANSGQVLNTRIKPTINARIEETFRGRQVFDEAGRPGTERIFPCELDHATVWRLARTYLALRVVLPPAHDGAAACGYLSTKRGFRQRLDSLEHAGLAPVAERHRRAGRVA